jgi:ATP-dependent DNA helicase RecG
VIEKEKVVVENWNKPYIPGIINPDNFYTHPKNPIILEVFKQIGRADELGSGVRNVFKYGKLYGDAEPVFEEGDIFKTTISIPNKYILKAEKGEYGIAGNDIALKKETNIDAVNDAVNDAVKDRLKAELLGIIKNKGLSLPQLMKDHTIRRATAQRDMKILKEIGFVSFVGAPKTGKYTITKKLAQILNKL